MVETCISDIVSNNFIDRQLVKKQKINFYSTEYVKYIDISKRNIPYYSCPIVDKFLSRTYMNKPLYVLVNLKFDDKDNKHACAIIITPELQIIVFDPNGKLNMKGTSNYKYENNLVKIAKNVALELSSPFDVIDLMKDRKGINTVGGGNCDAIVLWVFYLLSHGDSLENLDKFIEDMSKDPKKVTSIMNDTITKMSSGRF